MVSAALREPSRLWEVRIHIVVYKYGGTCMQVYQQHEGPSAIALANHYFFEKKGPKGPFSLLLVLNQMPELVISVLCSAALP